jgi:hypothetical protein
MKKSENPLLFPKNRGQRTGASPWSKCWWPCLFFPWGFEFLWRVWGDRPGGSKRQSPFACRQPLPRASPDPEAEELLPGHGDDGPRLRLALFHPGPLRHQLFPSGDGSRGGNYLHPVDEPRYCPGSVREYHHLGPHLVRHGDEALDGHHRLDPGSGCPEGGDAERPVQPRRGDDHQHTSGKADQRVNRRGPSRRKRGGERKHGFCGHHQRHR